MALPVLQKKEEEACSALGAGLAKGSTSTLRGRTGDWPLVELRKGDVVGDDEGVEEVDEEAEASGVEVVEEEPANEEEAEGDEEEDEVREDEEVDSAEAPEYDATPVTKCGALVAVDDDVVGVVADE